MQLLDSAADALALYAPDGTFRWVSAAARTVLGHAPAALAGRAAREIVHPDDQLRVEAFCADGLARASGSASGRYRVLRADGRPPSWVEATGQPLRDTLTGAVTGLIVTVRDIDQLVVAEQAREVELQLAETIFDQSPMGLTVFRAVRDEVTGAITDLRIERRNACARALVGLPPGTTDEGRLMRIEYPTTESTGVFEQHRQVLLTGIPWEGEVEYRGEGIDGWFQLVIARLDAERISTAFIEVTATRRAEQAAAEAREQLALAAEVAGVGLSVREVGTNELTFSTQARALYGLAPDAPVSWSSLRAQMHPDDQLGPAVAYDAAVATAAAGQPAELRMRFRIRRANDGQDRVLLRIGRVQPATTTTPARIIGALIDITEAEEAAARVTQAEQQLRLAAEVAGLGLSILDTATNQVELSPSFARLLGWPAERTTATNDEVLARVHPDDVPVIMPVYAALRRDGGTVQTRYRLCLPDGTERTVLTSARRARAIPTGSYQLLFATLDITDAVRAERAAAQSQAQLALASEVAGLGLSIRDVATGELEITPAFARLYGLPEDQLRLPLTTLLDLTHPDDRREVRPAFDQKLADEKAIQQAQFRIRRADTGQERTLLASARRAVGPAGTQVLSVTLDTTELTRARAADEESRFWRRLTDGLSEIIWVADAAGITRRINQRWYDYTGQTEADIHANTWQRAIHPTDFAAVYTDELRARLAAGESYEIMFRLRRHDGVWRWHVARAVPLRDDPAGPVTNWVGLTVDIHERHEAEHALRRANADLDTFIYAAAHDLKSPIDNLEGILAALAEELADRRRLLPLPAVDAAQDALLDHASRSVARFRATLADLAQVVDLSRPITGRQASDATLDLATTVADLVLDMDPEFAQAGGLLCVNLSVALLPLPARHQRSLLFNLFSNALKYRFPGRPARLWLRTRLLNDDWVELALTDNGVGLDASQATRAFELFGRLHPGAAGGTGIGLFIVRRLVEQAGGSVRVSGKPGVGTTFFIRLPR